MFHVALTHAAILKLLPSFNADYWLAKILATVLARIFFPNSHVTSTPSNHPTSHRQCHCSGKTYPYNE
jgi:hypothetical protein